MKLRIVTFLITLVCVGTSSAFAHDGPSTIPNDRTVAQINWQNRIGLGTAECYAAWYPLNVGQLILCLEEEYALSCSNIRSPDQALECTLLWNRITAHKFFGR